MLIKLLIQSIVYIITSRRVVLLLTLPINISCCVSLCHNSLYVWSRWIDKFNLLTHLIIWQVILASWCSVTVIFLFFDDGRVKRHAHDVTHAGNIRVLKCFYTQVHTRACWYFNQQKSTANVDNDKNDYYCTKRDEKVWPMVISTLINA